MRRRLGTSTRTWEYPQLGVEDPCGSPPKHLTEWGRPSECLTSQSQWPVVICLEYGRLILLSLRNLRCLAQEWVRRGSDIVLDPGRMCGMHNYKMRVCQCRQYQTALYAHLSTLSTAADCIECGGLQTASVGETRPRKQRAEVGVRREYGRDNRDPFVVWHPHTARGACSVVGAWEMQDGYGKYANNPGGTPIVRKVAALCLVKVVSLK